MPAQFPTIQSAIIASVNNDTVIVSPGTYFETINTMGKAITVRSMDPSDPSVVTATIIDATGLANSVVRCENGEGFTTVIQGFTLQGGDSPNFGGGILCLNSSPTIRDCVIRDNTAFNSGGGLHTNATPMVFNCHFIGNRAEFNNGGGFSSQGGGGMIVECVFENNVADFGSGGGLYATGASVVIRDSVFRQNTAANFGGGVNLNASTTGVVERCVFEENTSTGFRGGGLANTSQCDPDVIDCVFRRNTSAQFGGGLFNFNQSDPRVINCVFWENSSSTTGGAIANIFASSPTIINSTFSGNSAALSGGTIRNENTSLPTISNSILWASSPDMVSSDGTSSATIMSSIVEGGFPASPTVIDADPLFDDAAIGDLRIGIASPALDAGDDSFVPLEIMTDLDGNDRFVGTVDIGAYENLQLDTCPGNCDDANAVVNFQDLVAMLGLFGEMADERCDPNGSGIVNFQDLVDTLSLFGPCPDPSP